MTSVVHYKGAPADKLRRSWQGVREHAGLDQHVVQHTFRHTCVTWMLQAGVPAWEVAGYVGMSINMIQDHYGHHHPDYQANATAPKKKKR